MLILVSVGWVGIRPGWAGQRRAGLNERKFGRGQRVRLADDTALALALKLPGRLGAAKQQSQNTLHLRKARPGTAQPCSAMECSHCSPFLTRECSKMHSSWTTPGKRQLSLDMRMNVPVRLVWFGGRGLRGLHTAYIRSLLARSAGRSVPGSNTLQKQQCSDYTFENRSLYYYPLQK